MPQAEKRRRYHRRVLICAGFVLRMKRKCTKVPETGFNMTAEKVEDLELSLPDLGFVPVRVRHSGRARKLRLKIAPYMDGIEVVLPQGATKRVAMSLLRQNSDWVKHHLTALPDRVPLISGNWVPVMGRELLIRSAPEAKRGVWEQGGYLYVSGDAEHTERRVADYLKKRARKEAALRAHAYAERIGKSVGRVRVRDTRSRWGSCTDTGNLMFSWRLLMAPANVFDYVIAHEVAHLREMNHSAQFWSLVEELFGNSEREQRWLKQFGGGLHRYGPQG